ncbi:MAG TPA: hypothetical protein PLO26_10420 [Nitrosomonas europaea]|uniref:Uncharacterized protein n=1 Tax=Nitrosomonas eutropha TaxID=916 RepID=A0A1I7F111_9PROT|nr:MULTISPECIES: hypothetical protein [Nitrosomonas]SFU29789.1 hypothetical protein SAMN05216339_101216 [Nitrosomonas eutropha]HRN83058.1 hypothetical protein [Nitrosomonas europaea]HRO57178.1 hypothetical protein [Nitrosomonas europaea]
MTSMQEAIIDARLSIQRALLGAVSANLRAVVFSIEDRQINVRFYFDGLIEESDFESASCVETEILADYQAEDTVTVECIRLDSPGVISDAGVWVYHRQEASGE